MTIRLTPDQESIVRSALARGLAASAEDFVSAALREKHAGASFDQWVREEVIPGHEEYQRDPSSAVPVDEVMAEIRKRRAAAE